MSQSPPVCLRFFTLLLLFLKRLHLYLTAAFFFYRSATFTVLQQDRSSITALVRNSTVYPKQHHGNNYKTIIYPGKKNMTKI